MTKPKLSVCIATYNRAEYISETLESIIPQITNEIEIIIVDGASTDNTKEIVEKFAYDNKQIIYKLLPFKGGVDQDYCKAIELANGKMCWLFTDDDILKPNAINKVLSFVDNDYSLILVNAQLMNADLSKELNNKILSIQNDEIISDINILFQKSISYMSFIGGVVINRNLWMQRDKLSYFGTEFIHVGVIFQSLLPSKTLIISEPYIQIRYGNALWSKRAFEIGVIKWPNLLNSFKDISLEIKNNHNLTKFKHKLYSTIFYRAKGAYSINDYIKWYSGKESSIGWKFISFFVAIFPHTILNFILLYYFKIIHKEKSVIIYDLENSNNKN